MRFSHIQIFNQGLQSFSRIQSDNLRIQEQISSGRKVLTPSDDPIASTRIQKLQDELVQNEQFQNNIQSVDLQLRAQETYIDGAEEILMRARDLTVQAGNGALTHADRRAIATEISTIRDEMLSIANARDGSGKYVFAGYQTNTAPYAEEPDGRIEYVGDEGERSLAISSTTSLSLTTTARSLFTDIVSAENTFATKADATNTADPPATISVGEVTDQATFDSFFQNLPDDFILVFQNPPTEYDVLNRSGGTFATSQTYVSGEEITLQGMTFAISGTPESGDRFHVKSRLTQSIFETFDKLLLGLESLGDSGPESVQLSEVLAASLENMDNTLNQMLQVRTSIGSRLNVAESTLNVHRDVELLNQEILSDIRDLDYEEAISRLSYQSFVLEAAQQSFSRIANLSLFNFLR
ncbi:MAG: flagellar hook-associated protein FlgL [Pseudomonadales bacterium]